jgi:hypothetical protein
VIIAKKTGFFQREDPRFREFKKLALGYIQVRDEIEFESMSDSKFFPVLFFHIYSLKKKCDSLLMNRLKDN